MGISRFREDEERTSGPDVTLQKTTPAIDGGRRRVTPTEAILETA